MHLRPGQKMQVVEYDGRIEYFADGPNAKHFASIAGVKYFYLMALPFPLHLRNQRHECDCHPERGEGSPASHVETRFLARPARRGAISE